jgi:tetratricopeptide (TPR) repeat protein
VALVLIIAWASIVGYRRGVRGPALTLAFFAVTIFPALGFFNVYPMRFSFVADHFQYLASLGIIALVVGGLATMVSNRAMTNIAGALILAVLAILTWRQCFIYENEKTLWRDVALRNPRAWIAHNNLAEMLSKQGEYDEALKRLELALTSTTSDKAADQIRLNRAIALGKLGRHQDALKQFQWLQQSKGGMEVKLAQTLERLGRDDEAETFYRKALDGEDRSEALTHFGLHLLRLGRPVEAVACFESFLELHPEDADVRMFLADSYAGAGRLEDAIHAGEQALERARSQGKDRMAGFIVKRLEQYRGGLPPPK